MPLTVLLTLTLILASSVAQYTAPTAYGEWPLIPPNLGSVLRDPLLDTLQPAGVRGPDAIPQCTVTEFGAVGDNKTEDTNAVLKALNSCITVVFPSGGSYLMRSVLLNHSNTHIVIEANATVVGWSDPDSWNTSRAMPALFQSTGSRLLSNVSFVGHPGDGASLSPATIDGQGWRWWPWGKTRPRPKLLELSPAESVVVTGLRFKDSPSFNMLIRGDKISITKNRVEANLEACGGYSSAPNTDAYNIGGTNIYLGQNFNHNGDDGIPVNVGVNGTETRNVLVEDHESECGTNSGVIIIGSGTHSIRDVLFKNISATQLNQGAGMKISEAYENVTGQATNITWDGLHILRPRNAALYINVFFEDANQCTQPSNASDRTHWLSAYNMTFKNVVASMESSNAQVGCFNCAPTRPCMNITFSNVTFHGGSPYHCHNTEGVHLQNSPPMCKDGTIPSTNSLLG